MDIQGRSPPSGRGGALATERLSDSPKVTQLVGGSVCRVLILQCLWGPRTSHSCPAGAPPLVLILQVKESWECPTAEFWLGEAPQPATHGSYPVPQPPDAGAAPSMGISSGLAGQSAGAPPGTWNAAPSLTSQHHRKGKSFHRVLPDDSSKAQTVT